jgi:hypothetical protein
MKPTNTLQKEIARLFQLGKKNTVPYISTPNTQTLMNLYLLNKHSLIDPFHINFIDELKRYAIRNTRYESRVGVPIHWHWELHIYFDKNGKVLHHNGDGLVEIFRDNIIEMTRVNRSKKFICEFGSGIYVENECVSGHSEMIIFDPAFNTIEYIDSNNVPKQCSRSDRQYFTWTEIRLDIVRKIVESLPSNPIFITNNHIYTGYEWGIQSMEASSDLLTEQEKSGYCLMWSHLLGDLAMQFPEYSMKEIIDTIVKKSKLKTVTLNFRNDYMLYLIRGYVYDISQVVGVDFTSDDSKRDASCRIVTKL